MTYRKSTPKSTRGPRPTSMRSVAKTAKVSLATVSRVMTGDPRVEKTLRTRVLQASRQLGFVAKVRKETVAVVTGRTHPDIAFGYVGTLTRLLFENLTRKGLVTELVDAHQLDFILPQVQGILAVVFDDQVASSLRGQDDLPVVALNNPTLPGVHSVRTDHFDQGRRATEHLLKMGHTQIAFLSNERHEWGASERLRGYGDALSRARVKPDSSLARYSMEDALDDILTSWTRSGVTALLNFGEDTSLEVLRILTSRFGLEIGKNFSTICIEDIPIYRYLTPPQTTIDQKLPRLASLAVEKLSELIRMSPQERSRIGRVDECIECSLIERGSVGPAPPSDSRANLSGRNPDNQD
jgi:LacI family transcriptional regulator